MKIKSKTRENNGLWGINICNIFTVCNLLVIKNNTEIYSVQSDGKSGNAELFIKRLQNNAKWHCS